MESTFFKDVKHSLRMFRQSPGFALTAVAAMTLGIGVNTAIFSVVNAVLLKPVPFPEPDRLVMVSTTVSGEEQSFGSPAKFFHWKSQDRVVERVAAFRDGVTNYTGGDAPEQLRWEQVSEDFFRCFGAPIIRGRGFSHEEDLPKGPRAVLISEAFWRRRFAADPHILEKEISLSGAPHVVVGIVGANFDMRELGRQPDVFTAFQFDPNTTDQGHYFRVAGRLKAGVSMAQAQARFNLSSNEFKAKYPKELGDKESFSVQLFRDSIVGDVRESLLVLLGAVGLVLLIACANVANLLLVRATGRRREMAIRAAIGAERGRIIRQLLTESVILSLVGGVLGLVAGYLGIRALLSVNTADLPRLGENGGLVGMDLRVVAFTLLVSLATGLIFGLIPALQGSRADLNSVLKDSSGRSGTGFRQNKTRSLLVISEVTLAVILLVGSALLIRSSIALSHVAPGFDTQNILLMRMSLTGPRFMKAMPVEQMVRDSVTRIKAIPGVMDATATCCIPLQGAYGLPFNIVGRPLDNKPSTGGATWSTTSPGLFEIYKIPVKRGRAFDARDDVHGPPVVIISEAMAKEYWKNGDPLNDRLKIGEGVMAELKNEPVRQIIGVVGDVHDGGLNDKPSPHMYVPQGQVPDALHALNVALTPMIWVVRTQGEPLKMSGPVQETLRQTTGLPVSDIQSMEQVMAISLGRQRFNMLLMTVFGCAALLLAAIGIYGLMAYSVEQRQQEIGIRLALGADPRQVKRMVVMQGMVLALVGVVLGIAGAFGLSKLMESLLFGVQPRDPLVFGAVPLVLTAVALLAIWFPAARASRVSPLEALRYE